MTDPIKDFQKLRELFPGMDEYVPDPETKADKNESSALSAAEKASIKLYVSRDKKMRAGKQVTLVQGHTGPPQAMEKLLSALKALCSAGGSLKEGELIIQGDHVKKVMDYLLKEGYKQTRQKGG